MIRRHEQDRYRLISSKNDIIFWTLTHLFTKNPTLILGGYFTCSLLVTILLGGMTGLLFDKSYSPAMSRDFLALINIGLITPLGAAALLNLYSKIDRFISTLMLDNALKTTPDRVEEIAHKAQRLYENKTVVVLAFLTSLLINAYILVSYKTAWFGINGGVTSFYFRIFVVCNYYMVILIPFKCGVTLWLLRKVSSLKLNFQPMHPDKCGGLKVMGSLSVALNYFLGIVLLFLSLVAIFEPDSLKNILFVGTFILFILASFLILAFGLSKTHKQMSSEKEKLLLRLHQEFQRTHEVFAADLGTRKYSKDNALKIQSLNFLYQLAEQMPVWPLDVHSISRFITTISVPIATFIAQFAAHADSFKQYWSKIEQFFLR